MCSSVSTCTLQVTCMESLCEAAISQCSHGPSVTYFAYCFTTVLLKYVFSKRKFQNLGRAHREKFYGESFETGHKYSVKGFVQDDDFILHKMYYIIKLLCNISPKTREFLEKNTFFV